MADEIELKLTVPARAWRVLPRHPALAAATALPAKRLLNIYFDTPEQDLRRRGVGLRLRKQGRQWLQTVKCAGDDSAGLSTRPEWEYPYRGEAFDFYPIDDEELRAWLSRGKLLRRLQPAFETRFSRQTWRVEMPQATLLLMADRGEILAGESKEALSEIELELVSGEAAALLQFARHLAQNLPLRPEPLSKAERGYRLAAGIEPAPHKAGPSGVSKEHSAEQAFRRIALACVAHVISVLGEGIRSTAVFDGNNLMEYDGKDSANILDPKNKATVLCFDPRTVSFFNGPVLKFDSR